jgi:hypothetical protein
MGFWPLAKTIPFAKIVKTGNSSRAQNANGPVYRKSELRKDGTMEAILISQFLLSQWQLAKQKFPRHLKRTANFKVLQQ